MSTNGKQQSPAGAPGAGNGEVTRRSFLRAGLGAASGLAALAAALSPLKDLDTGELTVEKFLQKHYGKLEDSQAVHPVFQLLDYPHFDMGTVNMTFAGSVWSNAELRFWSRPTYFHK